jgi:hypothetical protein
MEINNNKNQLILSNVGKTWEYLPDVVYNISQYLKKNDLIELSKVCKIYREQLRDEVFNSVVLLKRQTAVLRAYDNSLCRSEKFNLIAEELVLNLGRNISLVKEVKFLSLLPNYFIGKIFKLFSNINRVSILEGCSEFGLKSLIPILSELRNLKQIKLHLKFNTIKRHDLSLYYELFSKLNTIDIIGPWSYRPNFVPFSVINSDFTNLTDLTIISNTALSNLSAHMPRLIQVKLLAYPVFEYDKGKLKNFLNINPQLIRLVISDEVLNDEMLKTIYSLKRLRYLEIFRQRFTQIPQNLNNICSESIQHIKICRYFQPGDLKIFLNSCKNLKIVEIDNIQHYSDFEIDLISKNSKDIFINLLILKRSSWEFRSTLPKSILKYFSKVRLMCWENASKFNRRTLSKLNNWEFMKDYASDAKEYCLIKK